MIKKPDDAIFSKDDIVCVNEDEGVEVSLLNWIGALTLSLLLKLRPRKLEP